jgi:hypothetical protein
MQRELIYGIKKRNQPAKTKNLITATAKKQQQQRQEAREEENRMGI